MNRQNEGSAGVDSTKNAGNSGVREAKAKPIAATVRDNIQRLLREIGSELSSDPDKFPVAKLELLERLQKLQGAVAGARTRSGSTTFKLSLLGLALVSGFVYVLGPLYETRIDVNATVTKVAFIVDDPVSLFDDTPVESVSFDGVEESNLGRGWVAGPRSISMSVENSNSAHGAALANASGSQRSSVTLQPLTAASKSVITVSRASAEEGLRISVVSAEGNELAVIAFEGALRVSGVKSEFAAPQAVSLRGRSLVANFTPTGSFSLRRSIAVHGLSFEDPRARSDGPGQPLSTILQGSIIFPDVGGTKKPLESGQPVLLVRGRGLLRNLDATGKGLEFGFSGIADDIRDGFDDKSPSAMPRRLEWIRGNPRVSLLWTSLAWLAGTLAAAIKRWRELKK
jgi:hypothetical protein